MKIGIITYWKSEENYGQILQILALQYAFKRKGASPFLIRNVIGPLPKENKSFFSSIISIKDYMSLTRIKDALIRRGKKRKKEVDIVKRGFQQFKDEYISQSVQTYTPIQLYKNPPFADIYVCGSDQIWNYPNPIHFLDWCPKNKLCYSYAASFGNTKIPKYQYRQYAKYMKKFAAISVREYSGKNICKELGYDGNVVHCIDPTLLLTKEDYLNTIKIQKTHYSPFMLLYLLGNEARIDYEYIDSIALKKGLKILFVPSQGCCLNRYEAVYPSIEEMLGLINDASYIITNSFHGTVFSIIFNKQFYTIPLSGKDKRMNERLESLFQSLNITDRYYNKENINKNINIDYEKVNRKLSVLRAKSNSFIEQILINNENSD